MLGGASSSARTSMTVPCRPMAPSPSSDCGSPAKTAPSGGAEVAKPEGGGDVGTRRRQLVGKVLQGRAADAAADEQRVGDALRGERAAQRPGQIDRLPHLKPSQPLAAGAPR